MCLRDTVCGQAGPPDGCWDQPVGGSGGSSSDGRMGAAAAAAGGGGGGGGGIDTAAAATPTYAAAAAAAAAAGTAAPTITFRGGDSSACVGQQPVAEAPPSQGLLREPGSASRSADGSGGSRLLPLFVASPPSIGVRS